MSVIQSQQPELRYLKRKALEQESRIIGNALRDQIRAYGVDCIYYKLKETGYTDFKNIVDQNTMLRRAYGYDERPNYTLSTHMITYADVQTDIFQLNKYGHVPEAEIEFNFDKIDFACALATKYGQLKEYQIDESEIYCRLPSSSDISAFPFSIGESPAMLCSQHSTMEINAVQSNAMKYSCEMLTGWFKADIPAYEPNFISSIVVSSFISNDIQCYAVLSDIAVNEKYSAVSNIISTIISNDMPVDVIVSCFNAHEYTVSCAPYQHTDFNVEFPANEDLYRSLKYKIQNDDYLETKLYLTYVVNEVRTAYGVKSILSGYVHGSLLFYDIDMIGKYANMIRPSIGDLIAIDFPDDSNREMYEVTDCFDKQLTQDGISPLLHNYIWKCKAKRYVNAHEEGVPVNDADKRVEEMQRYDQMVDGIVTDQVSMYDTLSGDVKEDAVYGGMDTYVPQYDTNAVRPSYDKYDYVDDGFGIVLMSFKMGSKLVTNGYDLTFIDNASKACNIATEKFDIAKDQCVFEQGLRWLKATDNQIVFVNVEGESTSIVKNGLATHDELEFCLNCLYDKTLDEGNPINSEQQSFFKFKGTRSYIWSDGKHLFAKLASSKELFFIA